MPKSEHVEDAEPIVVSEFEKNSREVVRVRLTEYKGLDLLDIRAFYRDGEEWKPGKGLSLRRDQLPLLKKAIAAAEKAVKDGGNVATADSAAVV